MFTAKFHEYYVSCILMDMELRYDRSINRWNTIEGELYHGQKRSTETIERIQ